MLAERTEQQRPKQQSHAGRVASRGQRLALWLWVVNLGVAVGAGLYESRIVVSEWLYVGESGQWYWDAEAARHSNTGLRFWAFVSSGPLTLATLANLVLAFRSAKPLRNVWLAGASVGLAERIFTFAYFIPQMITLMSGELPQAEAVPLAQQWETLNYVRHGLLIGTWVLSLKAFSMAYALGRKKPA